MLSTKERLMMAELLWEIAITLTIIMVWIVVAKQKAEQPALFTF